jgi:hypothetical protein
MLQQAWLWPWVAFIVDIGAICTRVRGEGIFGTEQLEIPEEHDGSDVGLLHACGVQANPVEPVLGIFTGATGARRGKRSGGTIGLECEDTKKREREREVKYES